MIISARLKQMASQAGRIVGETINRAPRLLFSHKDGDSHLERIFHDGIDLRRDSMGVSARTWDAMATAIAEQSDLDESSRLERALKYEFLEAARKVIR